MKPFVTRVVHKVGGELLDAARKLHELDQFVVVEIGDDDVFGIASHVHHLERFSTAGSMEIV